MNLGSIFALPATSLRATAFVLRFIASTGERLADSLREAAEPPASAVLQQSEEGLVKPAPTPSTVVDTPAETIPPARLDVARLAAQTAPEILAALDGLGDVELSDLYEYESKHRRRRKVLDAITAAAAPPAEAAGPADIDLTEDVRQPDELVYTTQTPRR